MGGVFGIELNYDISVNYKLNLWFFWVFVFFLVDVICIFGVIVNG